MSYPMNENRETPGAGMSGMGIIMVFLAGAAVGAVAALLTTTKTGPEMRATVRSWAKGFGDGDTERHAADLERERERSMGGSYDRPAGT